VCCPFSVHDRRDHENGLLHCDMEEEAVKEHPLICEIWLRPYDKWDARGLNG
jgi:hypothetical protein